MRRKFFLSGVMVAVSQAALSLPALTLAALSLPALTLAALTLPALTLPVHADSGTSVKIVPVPPKDTTNAGLSEPRLPPRGTRVLPPVHGQPGPGAVQPVGPVVVPARIAHGRRPGVHDVRLKHHLNYELKDGHPADRTGSRARRAAVRRLHHRGHHAVHRIYRHRRIRSRRMHRRR